MEILVDFTNKNEQEFAEQGYVCEDSMVGKVYYDPDKIEACGQIAVNYMEYPWVSCFETEGVRIRN